MWFSNLRTSGKMLAGVGSISVLLWAVIAGAFFALRTNQDAVQRIASENLVNAYELQDIKATINLIRAKMFKVLVVPEDKQLLESEKADIEQARQEIYSMLQGLKERNANSPGRMEALQRLGAQLDEYLNTQTEEIWPALAGGDFTGAVSLVLGVQTDRIEPIRSLSSQLAAQEEARAEEALQQVLDRNRSVMLFYLMAGMASLILCALILVLLNQTVSAPLVSITGSAARVAEYDLTLEIEDPHRRDEVGSLITTTATMVRNLRSMANNINESVNVLASSTTEIMASTSQTAASITQMATAITETTTTVEEVKQTAQLSSQKARSVSDSAQRSNDLAKNGAKTVTEMGEGMRAIREDFKGIVQNIMELNERSKGIGAIIATVDEIAELSNVLAVNAAIEAAKAGEHGRSFAVVAQEMRSLSEQSKEATRQVRQLLGEIQRGVNTAGMATEQGSKAVEVGIAKSQEATASINQLLSSIAESAQAAMQIAASSQQQLVGMDQVAMAMESIRTASEQNVAATRQVEDSTRMVANLGRELRALVDHYKLPATRT